MITARYRRIVLFFARIILSFIFWDLILPRLGLRGWSRRTRPCRFRRSAAAFRKLAVDMGGVMIKVGQFLSSRVDVLPAEITDELSGLQDEVPPADFEAIRRVAEREFGMPLDRKFHHFDPSPLAAASLGQAHRARIQVDSVERQELVHETWHKHPETERAVREWGTAETPSPRFLDVVVKIQRPNIEQIVETDMAALRTVGSWLKRYRPISRRADVPALLDEFSRILYQEIDYLQEGEHGETFAENFKAEPDIRVPRVVWSHTTKKVLTLENVWAIKITDYEEIEHAGIDRGKVASRLIDAYLKQIFEDGFFHADPHPGNLFVNPLDGGGRSLDWQLTFVDFGMVGRVEEKTLRGLRELLIGVGTQDAGRVVKAYRMLDVLLPSADLEKIEQAEARVFERFWGKSMSELSEIDPQEVREFASEFRELIYTLPFQVPNDLVYLGRAVGILSGICTGLDPAFNIWEHLAPYARRMLTEERMGGGLSATLDEISKFAQLLIAMPTKMDNVLSKMQRGDLAVRVPETTRWARQLERSIRQVAGGIIFAALLLGGIQLYLFGETLFGIFLLAGSGLILLWILTLGIGRSR